MAFTKTRIWHGGVPGVATAVEPQAPPAETSEVPACTPEQAEAFERTAAALSASTALPGFEAGAPSPLAVTRFLPIEQLFSEQQQQKARDPLALTPVPSRRRLPTLLARLRARAVRYESLPTRPRSARRTFLMALSIALVLAGALALPLLQRKLGAVRAASARTLPATPEVLDVGQPAQVEAATRPPREREQATRATAKPEGLERSAVDALISGDLNRAAQIYGRLADGAPQEPVYREARHILLNQSNSP